MTIRFQFRRFQQAPVVIEFHMTSEATLSSIRELWLIEQFINANTDVRLHVEMFDEHVEDAREDKK